MKPAILAIDQGTTSTRAIVFDGTMEVIATSQQDLRQIYPSGGWVEHDAEEIWRATLHTTREALGTAADKGFAVQALGITNQRETVVVWDRETGEPIHNAIVWQDRRTTPQCDRLRADGAEALIAERTGLLLDPYFSATKVAWLLDNVDGAHAAAEEGRLACGTIDSFLLCRLTGGKVHATDVTNASRTSLFNIRTMAWDEDLLALFGIPAGILPEVRDCDAEFGMAQLAGSDAPIAIRGIAGDQQAALIGQQCFVPGEAKATYGTGAFILLNTGEEIVRSEHRLISTVAYRLGGELAYALEGSIFIAGAGMQWLRDGLGIVETSSESEAMARSLEEETDIVFVPALTGLGAPHWLPDARGSIFGISRSTGPAEIATAMLESVGYQTADLMTAMASDGMEAGTMRVDGGMARNDWMCQFLADILDVPIERPANLETTAVGAAYIAGRATGLIDAEFRPARKGGEAARFAPAMEVDVRKAKLARWQDAIAATKRFSGGG
ncbi:glycerol kinase GlpK [Citromicrobium bathyomarinum]|uniref:glycerol kinase GlpK n=1 Tax=Citromicrobium bathyomarinum TaxID=72174 RepID=UPI00315A66F8